MYNVSEDYREEMNRPAVKRTLIGQVGEVPFTAADIVKNSFSIVNQCSEAGEIKLGSVYTAMLQCTFRTGLVENVAWKGLRIEVSEGLYLESRHAYEYVPLGLFIVDEAIHGEKGVEIKAYDAMLSFEKKIDIETTFGTLYDLASLACETCEVELAMTASQMVLFPNGEEILTLYAENDLETWRDFLYWLGQTCCGFWTINRAGALELRKYGMTVQNTVTAALRYKDSMFSDFITEYSGISFYDAATKNELTFGNDQKLTYHLGKNPFMQFAEDADKENVCMAILNELETICYRPFELNVLCGPMYDLGDIVCFTGGRAGLESIGCIMLFDYNFERYHIEGFGSNPATASARSKTDKQIQSVSSSVNSDEIIYYKYTNSTALEIGDGDEEVISDIQYIANKGTTAEFVLDAILDVETAVMNDTYYDAVGTFKYELNGSVIRDWMPEETWADGKHSMHLHHLIEIASMDPQRIKVYLSMAGGKASIGMSRVKSYLKGQGLAAASSGRIERNLLTREQQNLDNWNSANIVNASVVNAFSDNENNVTVENVFTPASHVGPDGNSYEYYYEIRWNVSSSITMQYYIWSHQKMCGYLNGNGGMGYVVYYDPTSVNQYSNVYSATSNSVYVCRLYRNGSLVTQSGAVPATGVTSTDIQFMSANINECLAWLRKPEHNYPRKFLAIEAEIGKTYAFKAKISSPSGFSCDNAYGGYEQEWIAVMADAPEDNDTLKAYDGVFREINQYASVVQTQYAAVFTATESIHYLVVDFGQINDETTAMFKIKLGLYEV